MSLDARRGRAAFALTLLLSVTAAPLAMAQTTDTQTAPTKKPAKKKKKPKPPPADTDAPAEAAPAPTPAPTPPPVEAPPPEPAPAATPPPAAEPAKPDDDLAPITDVTEKGAKTYYFIGLRYRGTIIPKFMINIFADEGGTFYSNTIALELDIRRDNFSMIPSISYMSYGFGDTLFRQKGTDATEEFNYSDVSSSLGAVYVAADILWSKQINTNFSFEYGAGFGIGAIFGNLNGAWVTTGAGGNKSVQLTGSNGQTYSPCSATDATPNSGCNPTSHTNPTPNKLYGHSDPSWLNGGSVPVVFPEISIPELGIRFKPIKELEARLIIGFSLTGPFFQLSADYGLESRKTEPSASGTPAASDGKQADPSSH